MQVIETLDKHIEQKKQPQPKRLRQPRRSLARCPVCKKEGYPYIRSEKGHRYLYTRHSNEPPLSVVNGRYNWRTCWAGGRVYDSFEDLIEKKQKEKAKDKPVRIHCPKCNKIGRLGAYHPSGKDKDKMKYYVEHGLKKGFWGRKRQEQKRDRCYMSGQYEKAIVEKMERQHIKFNI